MIVLSLFDGMSCGQIALRELGTKIDTYYASEVDKYAIQQTKFNFPNTVQLGDVRNIDVDKLYDEVGEIDLLIGGSPCFAAGTKVLTSEGYKDIENVEVGDYVLTHQNRYRRVLRVGGKEAMTYNLKASGFVDTVCTANHPFYARKKQRVAYMQANGKRSYKTEAGNNLHLFAYARLVIIAEALNEGWKPKFDGDECRYYPWFYIYTKEEYEKLDEDEKKACRVVGRSVNNSYAYGGLVFSSASCASSVSLSDGGSRLAFKTRELGEYCGKQFIDIWEKFLFA